MREVLSSIGVSSLNRKRIAAIARIPTNRRVIAILTNGLIGRILWKVPGRTSQHTLPLQCKVNALMACIIGDVAVFSIGANSDAAISGQRFEVADSVELALVAV